MKSKFGAIPYMVSVLQDTPIGRAIDRLCNEDRNVSSVLFNLAKQERSFADFLTYLNSTKKAKLPALRNAAEIIVLRKFTV